MNHTQKLNDEALQAYRATGLSPMELVKQRDDLIKALQKYEEARDVMFAHCLSNGVFNFAGKSMNCTSLNDAHLLARNVLERCK